MNWLAHLFLSEPEPAFRIGSLVPDLVSMKDWAAMPAIFQGGIERHRQIDSFTDSHIIVRRSIERFPASYRRFSGILTDVFYDHFLARNWSAYAPVSLPEFAKDVYRSFTCHSTDIPPAASLRLQQIASANLLCSYGDLQGIASALERIDGRLSRPQKLHEAMKVLEKEYGGFEDDFTIFFPELMAIIPSASREHGH